MFSSPCFFFCFSAFFLNSFIYVVDKFSQNLWELRVLRQGTMIIFWGDMEIILNGRLLPPLKLPPPRRRGTTSDDCIAMQLYGSRSALSTGAAG